MFHTLPAPPVVVTTTTPTVPQRAPEAAENVQVKKSDKNKEERMHPSTALIPRLVSVVEIIKREYVKMLDPALAEKGALQGLHQYNELGELVTPPVPEEDEDAEAREERQERERREKLMEVLQGKNQ
jgi:hypothetical protein